MIVWYLILLFYFQQISNKDICIEKGIQKIKLSLICLWILQVSGVKGLFSQPSAALLWPSTNKPLSKKLLNPTPPSFRSPLFPIRGGEKNGTPLQTTPIPIPNKNITLNDQTSNIQALNAQTSTSNYYSALQKSLQAIQPDILNLEKRMYEYSNLSQNDSHSSIWQPFECAQTLEKILNKAYHAFLEACPSNCKHFYLKQFQLDSIWLIDRPLLSLLEKQIELYKRLGYEKALRIMNSQKQNSSPPVSSKKENSTHQKSSKENDFNFNSLNDLLVETENKIRNCIPFSKQKLWSIDHHLQELQKNFQLFFLQCQRQQQLQSDFENKQNTLLSIFKAQQQQIQLFQKQLIEQTQPASPVTLGVAYRLPETNLNLAGAYQRGKTSIQVSCVPDESIHFLGPNGFVHGVGPGNLGLSMNLAF